MTHDKSPDIYQKLAADSNSNKKKLEKLNGHYGGHKKIALIKHHYYTFTLQLGPALKKTLTLYFLQGGKRA